MALRIRIEHGQDAGKTYRLVAAGVYRIGRSPHGSFQVLDPARGPLVFARRPHDHAHGRWSEIRARIRGAPIPARAERTKRQSSARRKNASIDATRRRSAT